MLRRIYVGSLDYSVTTDMIRTLFSPFGSIVNVDMPIDPMTRRSKGFVFVDFLDQASAEAAMSSMNGFQLLGRPMKVNRPSMPGGAAAVPTPALGGFSGMPTMMNLGGAVGGAPVSVGAMLSGAASAAPSPGGVDAATAAARAAALAQTIAGPNSGFGNPKARIYVGSVPFEISAEQLKAVFSAFGDVRSCELLPGSDLSAGQQHRGYGFIEFAVCFSCCISWCSLLLLFVAFHSVCICAACVTCPPRMKVLRKPPCKP
jgi:poly(U)-binding-splicing factor PUF60